MIQHILICIDGQIYYSIFFVLVIPKRTKFLLTQYTLHEIFIEHLLNVMARGQVKQGTKS